MCTSEEHKEMVAKTYLQKLFSIANPNVMGPVLDLVERIVTPNMNNTLLQPYNPNEVKRAPFQMHPSKSPRQMVCHLSFSKNIGI